MLYSKNRTILETIIAVVETPRGKGHKYDYDPVAGYFKLKKVMPAGLVFPFDFGFIPGTVGDDGDPLDVLIISELETFTGCAVECRIIGALEAEQTERNGEKMRNDRFVAIPVVSAQYSKIKNVTDLPKGIMSELESFFENYNEQAGKTFKPLRRVSPSRARTLICQAKTEDSQTKLVQLFLPIKDESGKFFPKKLFRALNTRISKEFGGLTIYTRSPATGFWEKGDTRVQDDILVYEVLTEVVDEMYWNTLKQKLKSTFKQDEVMILVSDITRI